MSSAARMGEHGAASGRESIERARAVAETTRGQRHSQQREAEAQRRERRALENLEQARLREQRERNETHRRLRAREREIAERALEQTREHSERLAKITTKTRAQLESLAGEKGDVLDHIDLIPTDASPEMRRDEVDPLFDRLLTLRSTAHKRFQHALAEAAAAEKSVERAASGVEEARAHLRRERGRLDELDASKVWQRRVAVAQAAVELARQRHRHSREILEAHRDRVRQYHSHFGFFAGAIRPMLDRISDERRDAFFAVMDTNNWNSAVDGIRTGLRALEQRGEHRLEQLGGVDLASLELWGWLWGLLWRLAALLLLAHLALELLAGLVDRLCAALLRRRLLRRKAAVFVKLAEMLQALSRPVLLYLGIAFAASYAAERVDELLGLVWMVDALFIYWLVLGASRVAILPRSHRREAGEASAGDLDYIDQTRADNLADVTGVDLPRAMKLLGSMRVVVIFWLLAAYVPDFVEPLTGITVLWWLVDRAATWGVVAVIYWVLSRWRDEIAALFEKLAGERLAPAVSFVNRHKDRPWGVLVIAVTSLYVVCKEMVIVVRRYVLNTDWFKRLSALAFRTQIEMHTRARSSADSPLATPPPEERLDPQYLECFEDRPLSGGPYHVERGEYLERIVERLDDWRRDQRQGSIALVGVAGIGKTTLINRLEAHLDTEDAGAANFARFQERVDSSEAVISFVAELFGLEEPPGDQAELIAALCELPRRIVVLDDCHLSFSRHIEGFDGIDALLDIVHLCDHHHFFVLTFAEHAWRYVNRIEERGHYFGEIIDIEPWEHTELQTFVERRTEASGYSVSFAKMVAAHADTEEDDQLFDVIETSRGYYRYLHEFSGGIPRVAMAYWLASLRDSERERTLDVDLFDRPDTRAFAEFGDDHWFILAALVQHGRLSAAELAEVVHRELGFCSRTLDLLAEIGLAEVDEESGRAQLSARYWRPVIRRLAASKYLYGA